MTSKENKKLKKMSNNEFISYIINICPTGAMSQMVIIDILSKGVIDYRPTNEDIEEDKKGNRIGFIDLGTWQKTIDYIGEMLTLKYGKNEYKGFDLKVNISKQSDSADL